MTSMRASVITAATIRVAGQVATDISISHLGTPEQEASLRIGELLIYVRDPHIAHRVAQLWTQARAGTSALPHVIGASRLHLPVRVGLVGVIVRLGGEPLRNAHWVAGRPGVAEPSEKRRDRTHRLGSLRSSRVAQYRPRLDAAGPSTCRYRLVKGKAGAPIVHIRNRLSPDQARVLVGGLGARQH